MTVQVSDIVVVLTGGHTNSNPNESIGGNPSNIPITGVLNNLFDSLSDEDAIAGRTDYRCIYVFNNNSTDSFYDLKVHTSLLIDAESDMKIGFISNPEIQNITLSGAITGGSFDVSYNPPTEIITETRTVNYDADPVAWALNLQTALNSIPTFSGIIVAPTGTFVSRVFSIIFPNTDIRSHDLLGLDITSMTGTVTGAVSKATEGSPINTIPTLLDAATTPPTSVVFIEANTDNPFTIGTLYPEEGFPVWIKRTIAAGANPMTGDGFTLQIVASPIVTS